MCTSPVKPGTTGLRDQLHDLGRSSLRVPTEIDHLPPTRGNTQITILVSGFQSRAEVELPAMTFDAQAG
ncbi:MAG TPA: hypothetical protein VNB52_12260, partial [Ilumatobacteraceae bacterium]|nr:hypothetical protein [Ilumatobacteraceae bacterium]